MATDEAMTVPMHLCLCLLSTLTQLIKFLPEKEPPPKKEKENHLLPVEKTKGAPKAQILPLLERDMSSSTSLAATVHHGN